MAKVKVYPKKNLLQPRGKGHKVKNFDTIEMSRNKEYTCKCGGDESNSWSKDIAGIIT